MNILGIITEYNPFHNGHLYHLNSAKEASKCDYTICVMSSNFIQRGEPSIINKWARTKSALLAGVDIVIELPTLFSMSSAEYFCYGSVKILDSLNCVNSLCFGSESGSIDELSQIADLLINEDNNFKEILKQNLKKGVSYAKARDIAISQHFGESSIQKFSNNILGIEYLKALKRLQSTIKPITINRISNNYNSKNLSGPISSATSIRTNFESGDIQTSMPDFSYRVLLDEINNGRGPIYPKDYFDCLLAILRRMSQNELSKINFVNEGLHQRVKQAVNKATNFEELINLIETKRYPKTRVQRILFSGLLGIKNEDLQMATNNGGPPYAKILGFNKRGREILGEITKSSSIPVVTNLSKLKNNQYEVINRMIEIEEIASDLYVLAYKKADYKIAGQEFTSKVVTI